MKGNNTDFRLYAVTDRSWVTNEYSLEEQVTHAIEGGVTFVQLREKKLSYADFYKEAQAIQRICKTHHIPFVINDNVDLAQQLHADGVHVGQDDLDVRIARKKLGADKIIGVSAHSVEEAIRAEKNGADYLGVGAVFPTASKQNVSAMDVTTLRKICDAVSIPVVAIGGINQDNMEKLRGSGIQGVAVIRALFSADDIVRSAKQLKEKVQRMIEGES